MLIASTIPPAVALQQQRGTPTTRSSVGSVTTLSNLLRMLYSRAADYPPGRSIIYAEAFSRREERLKVEEPRWTERLVSRRSPVR